MKFKPGDLVIKSTGGNKMKIISPNSDGGYDCGWVTEKYHEQSFSEDDLIPLSQYKSSLINEKRDDLINQILSQ